MSIHVSLSPDLGIILQSHITKPMFQILDCRKSIVAAQIPKLQSLISYTYLYSINNTRVHIYEDYHHIVLQLQISKANACIFTLVSDDTEIPPMFQNGTLQVYFDQLNVVHSHMQGLYEEHYDSPKLWEPN